MRRRKVLVVKGKKVREILKERKERKERKEVEKEKKILREFREKRRKERKERRKISKEEFKKRLPRLEVKEEGRNWKVGRRGKKKILPQNLIPEDRWKDDIKKTTQTKYDPDFHPYAFLQLCKEGFSVQEIGKTFGVSVTTMERWAERWLNFAEAWEVGRTIQEGWWLREGRMNLYNNRYNNTLYKFLTGNMFGWSDKIESRNMNMNAYGVMVAPREMGEEEWEKRGEEVREKREELVENYMEKKQLGLEKKKERCE